MRRRGPNRLWLRSQERSLLELFVKAQSAIIKKIVVGKPGINIPIKPKLTHIQPRDSKI